MASRHMMFLCRSCCAVLFSKTSLRVPKGWYKSPRRYFLTLSALFAHCGAKEKLDLQIPDASKLSQEYLLKAASAQTADAVSTLLSQAARALIQAEQDYRDLIRVLVDLLEYHLTMLGKGEEEDLAWDIILQGRARIEKSNQQRKDLHMLFSCVEKLADASAEVAFLSGSEFTSTTLGERLYNVKRHIEIASEESQKMEKQLQEAQAHCIKTIAEHAEKEEKRKKAEEEMFGSQESEMMIDNENSAQGLS